MRIDFMTAGYCTHPQKIAWAKGTWRSVRFPASVAVIEHPREGIILFDTGYSERFYAATKKFPERLYAQLTPTFIDEGTTALAQLKKRGITAGDVRHVILSHFHADHIAAASDFPQATYHYWHESYEAVRSLSRLRALQNAFLPSLLPADFLLRSRPWRLNEMPQQGPAELNIFGGGLDLFGDNHLWLLSLPGHAHGHAGLLVRTANKDYLLVGDACYLRENFIFNSPSSQLTRIFVSDYSVYKKTLSHLHHVHQTFSGLEIVPCHCETTLARLETHS